ncbi:molybdopterin cofactor-binding domain-containing protein [Aciditerrimonas ferrireducens]|uniref:molybdopterin cofactor-binding domain-containing protein n=1 Tax=Aciditerrimonas ferrireducens TaxID=667306 RepID=UPI00200464F1|nr:molybdopterin cofactor-binding domain-containing protein [Aciditerrimonas ferrireducens]MCK4176741.1 molybdopterin-dependent oxidoreductase [Aciditerrimonas ferrireducens]
MPPGAVEPSPGHSLVEEALAATVRRPASRPGGTTRRQFLAYVIGAPILVVAVDALGSAPANAATSGASGGGGLTVPAPEGIPSLPQPADVVDLGDLLILAGLPTANLITISVDTNGVAHFAMPRQENGQGTETAVAMIIADELDLPLEQVEVTLAPAEPKLVFNQLTGSSNAIRSLWDPVRTAAAAARGRLLAAASDLLGEATSALTVQDGVVVAPDGRRVSYGQLSGLAASPTTLAVPATPKDPSTYRIVGTPVPQRANPAIVTGAQRYAVDLDVPGYPTMVRRAPTIGGRLLSFTNRAAVEAMPGVLRAVPLPFGVAVIARTFGQAIDGVDAVEATFSPGPVADQSNATVRQALIEAPVVPFLPAAPLARTLAFDFDWAPVNHAPMGTNMAVADVRDDSATIWAPLQTPIAALEAIAEAVGLPPSAVVVNVVRGPGSFGRTLFFDAALEAAQISKAAGLPVRLMWHRTNDMRHGRAHPQAHHRIRATLLGDEVLAFEHRVTSVTTDVSPGLGEAITAGLDRTGLGKLGFSQTLFETTITCPYNFGVVTQLLTEVPLAFNTDSWRSVFSYNTRGAEEIVVDQIAAALGQDPVTFRLGFLQNDRQRAVVEKVAEVGGWGRSLPAGVAQGIGFHQEYQSFCAVLVELDTRNPALPRVTRAAVAVDVGLPVNPLSLEGQMLGGLTDGISLVLQMGNHVEAGLPVESGWGHFKFIRQDQAPREVTVVVMPRSTDRPGGAGELAVPAAVGAVANAWARATGTVPTSFPIIDPTIGWAPPPPGPVPVEPLQPLPDPRRDPSELYDY